MTIVVGQYTPPTPTTTTPTTHAPRPDHDEHDGTGERAPRGGARGRALLRARGLARLGGVGPRGPARGRPRRRRRSRSAATASGAATARRWRSSQGAGSRGADVVFPVLHGPFGEDGTVQGLLECLDVPYVGAGVLASALCMDKVLFKELMAHAGIPQVDYRAVPTSATAPTATPRSPTSAALGLPVFVKPARLGSSVGIVAGRQRATSSRPALETAFEHDPLAIVEAAAAGLEVECSVLGNGEPIASEPGEILLAAGEGGLVRLRGQVHAGRDAADRSRARSRARPRARSASLRSRRSCAPAAAGLARVDFFVDGRARCSSTSSTRCPDSPARVSSPRCSRRGVIYPELLDRLLELALERHSKLGHRFDAALDAPRSVRAGAGQA